MQLPVVIKYLVNHAQPGGRVVQKPVYETVEFDLETATTDEAPIAVRWNDEPHETQVEGWDTWDASGEAHTRWFAGRHWHPLYPENIGHGPVKPLEVEEVRDMASADRALWHFLGNMEFGASLSPKTRHVEFDDAMKAAEVRGTRDSVIEKVREALSKLVAVDGIVYRACHEPHIVMIQAINQENASRITTPPRSMRIVTEEIEIRTAVVHDAHGVAPVSRFDILHDLNRLFDRYGSTAIDAKRRPQIDVWESIDEDAYWDRVGTWRMQEFIAVNADVSIKDMTTAQLSAVNEASVASSIDDRDERLEAIERAARSIAATWPDYQHVDSLVQLAEDLGAREVNVPIPTETLAGPRR
jgi:hypothetical protein